MRHLLLFISVISILFFLTTGCSRRIYRVAYPTLSDGAYDTEFPYKSCSRELEKVARSVRKLTCIAYYQSYVFSEEGAVTPADVQADDYLDKATREIFYNNSVIGSATVINYQNHRILLLTCAHVVDFPDTIWTYFKNQENSEARYVQSVAFKKRQSNYVADLPERGELEVLATDEKSDIAVVGRMLQAVDPNLLPVFNYPLGHAKDLEWGSFVYLLGYPKGYLMVTKGIVSQPNRDKNGSFIVDALFNKGFSGGIVLAIRDGVPNFEMVGMASSVSADYGYYMSPSKDLSPGAYDPHLPYKNNMFVEFKKNINYGITFIISTERIIEFLRKNQARLSEKGYDISDLLSGSNN